jgi:hypothetical protein
VIAAVNELSRLAGSVVDLLAADRSESRRPFGPRDRSYVGDLLTCFRPWQLLVHYALHLLRNTTNCNYANSFALLWVQLQTRPETLRRHCSVQLVRSTLMHFIFFCVLRRNTSKSMDLPVTYDVFCVSICTGNGLRNMVRCPFGVYCCIN